MTCVLARSKTFDELVHLAAWVYLQMRRTEFFFVDVSDIYIYINIFRTACAMIYYLDSNTEIGVSKTEGLL